MSDLSDLIKTSADTLEAQLREAYERGRRDERERILQIASIPHHGSNASASPEQQTKGRAARGTIRPLVQQVLRTEPGLSKHEVGERVVKLNPDVSPLSAANELQRNDIKNRRGRKLYRCSRGRWFLVEEEEEEELEDTAGIAENDHPPLMNGAEAPA
jgi:hypothetical protein